MIAAFDGALSSWAADWLLTFAIHSTCILGLALLVSLVLRDRQVALQERLLRCSLWVAVVSATLQLTWAPTVLPLPLGGDRTAAVAAAPPGVGLDTTARPGDDGPGHGPPAALATRHSPAIAGDESTLVRTGSAAWPPSHWSIWAWPLATWVVVLAAIGGGTGGLWLLRTHVRLRRILRRREPETDGRTLTAAASAAAAMGLRQSPHVSRSDDIFTPIAFGLLRPEICLPRRASVLADDELRAMLAHEIAHLQRRDPVWMWLAAALQAAFPWQILTGLVRRRWGHLVELRCDAVAAAQTSPTAVARCLLDVAEWLRPARPVLPIALGMAARPSALRQRVDTALRGGATGRLARSWSFGLSGLSLSALTFVAPGVETVPTPPASADGGGLAGAAAESGLADAFPDAFPGPFRGAVGGRPAGQDDGAATISDATEMTFDAGDADLEVLITATMSELHTERQALRHELQQLRLRAGAASPARRLLVAPLITEISQRLLIVDRSCARIRTLLDRRAAPAGR